MTDNVHVVRDENEGDVVLDDTFDESFDKASAEVEAEESQTTEVAPEAEAEASQEPAEEAPAFDWDAVPWDEYQWDGQPHNLPRALKEKVHDPMMRAFTRKTQEVAELKRELESKREQAAAKPETDGEPPPIPPDGADEALVKRMWQERESWFADQAARRHIEPIKQQYERQLTEVQEQMVKQRVDRIRNKQGYNPQVEEKMVELGYQFPHWAQALQTDDGADQLFDYALSQVTVANTRADEAKRKATAHKRTVSRPKEAAYTKAASAEETYGDSFEEAWEMAERQLGSSG